MYDSLEFTTIKLPTLHIDTWNALVSGIHSDPDIEIIRLADLCDTVLAQIQAEGRQAKFSRIKPGVTEALKYEVRRPIGDRIIGWLLTHCAASPSAPAF